MSSDSTDAKNSKKVSNKPPPLVVGLGASAGGLNSLENSLKKMPGEGQECTKNVRKTLVWRDRGAKTQGQCWFGAIGVS